jgi:hypothetical protein
LQRFFEREKRRKRHTERKEEIHTYTKECSFEAIRELKLTQNFNPSLQQKFG